MTNYLKNIEMVNIRLKAIEADETKYLRPGTAAIVCSSYTNRLKKAGRFPNWLIISFADIDNPDRLDSFTPAHAELIRTFVDGLGDNIKRLYICTDRAESRGQAIRAALLLYSGRSDLSVWKNPEHHPNPLVYETLLRVFGIGFPRIRTVLRKGISRRVLKKAVERR